MPWPTSRDDELFGYVQNELERQNTTLQLIASENFASPAVLEASGSVLTNKYAEGYPGKRYYGGNIHVDEVEDLARERVKALFGADHANVQPHSGANANMAVYQALLEPGDTVLGLSLDHGGHLTHGSPVNASGKLYNFVSYGLSGSDERIDMDELRDTARAARPKMIVAGATAYPRIIQPAPLRDIADEVGALLMADIAHIAGLVATGHHPSPFPHCHVVTTTTHKTLRGPRGGLILAKSNEEIEKKLNAAVFPGAQGGPLMHVIAGKAVCFKEALEPEFKSYQKQVIENAQAMAQVFIDRGYDVVSGGTDNHLFLVSLIRQGLTGKDADAALGRAHITVNKNAVPNDPQSPFVTSGLRIGTPAVTTRGFKVAQCVALAGWICDVLDNLGDADVEADVASNVAALCADFPVYR